MLMMPAKRVGSARAGADNEEMRDSRCWTVGRMLVLFWSGSRQAPPWT